MPKKKRNKYPKFGSAHLKKEAENYRKTVGLAHLNQKEA
uniref:Uncharacterized protein n=1 Tax=Rhizophora mucronata TaxID=61149 RepID=A0A2P2PEA6_RHIMU